MGPVFRTYDPHHDRLVAVKAFRLDLVPEQVARLAESLRRLATAGLTQPTMVAPLDAGLEGTTAYLAMEYVAAETLDVALRHLAPAPLDRALPLLSEMADAIDRGWALGQGHGALHPRDVFVTVDVNDVQLSGLGVIPALETLGVKSPVRRPYAAPERINGEPWGIRADIYSLGAIAHELLTRRRPAGPGEQDGALTTGISPEQRVQIRRVLATVLAERPEDRFASARAFIDALSAVADGETIGALPSAARPVPLPPQPDGSAPIPFAVEPNPLSEAAIEFDVFRASRPTPVPASTTTAKPVAESVAPKPIAAAPRTSIGGHSVMTPPESDRPEGTFPSERPARRTPTTSPGTTARKPAPTTPAAPAFRANPPAPAATFPWAAMTAVLIAGIALGLALGYQLWGRYLRAAPPSTTAAVLRSAPLPAAADTDVPVPAETRTGVSGEAPPGTASKPGSAASAPSRRDGAPSRSASPTSRLVVQSTPPGALLIIDGHPRGQTPVTVSDLQLGDHRIEVGRPGYVPHVEHLTLRTSAVRNLSVQLEPGGPDRVGGAGASTAAVSATGSIFVDSRPQAARVAIDGRFIGMTPLRVPEMDPGAHTVQVELPNHKTYTTKVGVKAGQQARVTAALEGR